MPQLCPGSPGSAPALPRLAVTGRRRGRRRLTRLARAVRSSSTVMPYMAFISTNGLLFIHAADLHWRSCTEGADWSPACSRDWGISGEYRILVTKYLNPRLTGVSAERNWPGGAYNAPPQANSQTNDRSETGEAALERSRRESSKALLKLFLKGHVSGQGQVKGQNWAFQHFGSQNRQLDSNRPKLGRNTLKC